MIPFTRLARGGFVPLLLLFAISNASILRAQINSSNNQIIHTGTASTSLFRTVAIGEQEQLKAINITTNGSLLAEASSNLLTTTWFRVYSPANLPPSGSADLLGFANSSDGVTGPDELTFRIDTFSGAFQVDFVYASLFPELNRIGASAAQTQFQTQNFHFQSLGNQLRSLVRGRAASPSPMSGGYNFAAAAAPSRGVDDLQGGPVRLVGFERSVGDFTTPSAATTGCRQSHCSSSSGRRHRAGQWNGWMQGYGIEGGADAHDGMTGFDYGAGGTQLGLFRDIDHATVAGVFGTYGHQNVRDGGGGIADINSAMFGGFLHRQDSAGNYAILAANVAYDDYDTTRAGGAITGNFDGAQTGLFLQRGWNRQWRDLTLSPNVGLQYLWVHQDDYTDSSGVSFDDLDAHSLRSLVGFNVNLNREYTGPLGVAWSPHARVAWMQEFLDPRTAVTGVQGGTRFASTGLNLGRDWAVVGFGLQGRRDRALTWFAGYDIQANDRNHFQTGSGGIVWTH